MRSISLVQNSQHSLQYSSHIEVGAGLSGAGASIDSPSIVVKQWRRIILEFQMKLLALIVVTVVAAQSAFGQENRRASHCIAIAEDTPGIEFLQKASWAAAPPEYAVQLHYISHASFLLRTHGGLTAITDYTGFIGNTDFVPDIVTMNHAHTTHWTPYPDPNIPHILRGWGEVFGEGITHYLDLGEMVVRNVSTDIRSQISGREANGNSIFIFEVAGLCIGHLGHLHHVPSDEQFVALGRLDVVMAPVDGGFSLTLPEIITTLKRLRSSIVIPMHWFSPLSLDAFIVGMSDDFAIIHAGQPSLTISLQDLPSKPTVMVLQPRWLNDE